MQDSYYNQEGNQKQVFLFVLFTILAGLGTLFGYNFYSSFFWMGFGSACSSFFKTGWFGR